MDRFLQKNLGRRQPTQQVFNVSIFALAAPAGQRVANQPGVGNQFNDAVDYVRRDAPHHLRVRLSERAGELQQDVVFYKWEGISAALEMVVPPVMKVEGGSMIDEPESTMPYQHVRVARR